MRDCACWTLGFAACAEDDAVVGVFHDRPFLSVFFLVFVNAEGAIVDALAAAHAFTVVDLRSPWNLASRDAVPSFFGHFGHYFG